jgi:cyanoexosortase A
MKSQSLAVFRSLNTLQLLLLSLGSSLVAIYLTLVWKSDDNAHFGMSLLFGYAAVSLLWEQLQQPAPDPAPAPEKISAIMTGSRRWDSSIASSGLAALLMGWVLWQSLTPDATFPRLMPFVSAIALSLLASGWQGIKYYWRESTLCFFLGIPSLLVRLLPDISPITAQLAGFLLHYIGFTVKVDGVFVSLPGGTVEVYTGCSGIESMTYLLGMSVLALLLLPLTGVKRWIVPPIALLIAFLVNGCRVALMTKLVASKQSAAFEYWHTGDGSLVFGLMAIALFWLVYIVLRRQTLHRVPE